MSLNLKTLKANFINGKPYNLDHIIESAYKDLQPRTIKGHNASVQKKCTKYLKEQFTLMLDSQPTSNQEFENQHKNICDGFLTTINSFAEIKKQSYGKAQKVVNIIFKFLVAYGKWGNESQCHMPIDSFVLKWLYGRDTFNGVSWSNISYEDYVKIQEAISEKIKAPITVGNKSGIVVKNRAEADCYVWYITKVVRNYKDTKNIIKKLIKSIDVDDVECINKKTANEIIDELESLKKKIENLQF